MSDPNFSSVSLLLHCDGADGSTTFTDTSGTPKTVTAGGNAQIDTAQSKWGGASALFDGSGDYLSATASADFGFGTAAWTIEGWVRPAASTLAALFDTRETGQTGADRFIIGLEATTRTLFLQDGASIRGNTGTAPGTGAWSHIAVSYDGTTLRGFVGGALVWSATVSLNFAASVPLRIGATHTGTAGFNGHLDDIRVTKGVCRYTAAFSPATAAFSDADPAGYVASPGPLQDPQALGAFLVSGPAAVDSILGAVLALGKAITGGIVQLPAIFGSALVLAQHDFTGLLAADVNLYAMDLDTPGGLVRVPISSWQATLQTGQANYLQCVVPACAPYVDQINEATAFTILRRGTLTDGSVFEYAMASSPLDTAQMAQGTSNYTATLSGYSPGTTADADPPEALDRELQDVRAIFTQASGIRVRCAIDWLLRPANRAFVQGTPFVVSYINYYVSDGDQYMDVGERVEPA